jgi:hypothetical protein
MWEGCVMGRLFVTILGAVSAAAFSVAMFASGVASADAFAGKTYSDAAATISGWGGTPVIATVSGDQLVMDDCIVTSWHKSNFLNASGVNDRRAEYLLHLNCNSRLASPGHPGNSSMSEQGLAAKKDEQAAATINKAPKICEKDDKFAAWCKRVCERTKLCEV